MIDGWSDVCFFFHPDNFITITEWYSEEKKQEAELEKLLEELLPPYLKMMSSSSKPLCSQCQALLCICFL